MDWYCRKGFLNKHCDKCQGNPVHHEFLNLSTLRDFVILSISRFENGSRIKVSTSVSPSSTIQIGLDIFDLKATVSHKGPLRTEGHYVAHVLMPDGSFWLFDDERVSQRQEIDSTEVYLLLYVKRFVSQKSMIDLTKDSPPSSPRFVFLCYLRIVFPLVLTDKGIPHQLI